MLLKNIYLWLLLGLFFDNIKFMKAELLSIVFYFPLIFFFRIKKFKSLRLSTNKKGIIFYSSH